MVEKKNEKLKEILLGYGRIAVAFSGGVDSTFLLWAAPEALGENAVAMTASSCTVPARELAEAKAFCESHGIRQVIVETDELDVPRFRDNPPDRCYLCKHEMFDKMRLAAEELSITVIAEGSNRDDEGDYRPGMTAAREMGVVSPLREVGLGKEEIRMLSKEASLPTWDKPSFACLSSRFVYGERIDERRLAMVDRAEAALMELGFRQVRVRIHGDLARIELEPAAIAALAADGMREKALAACKEAGFTYVALDLAGYRTGSMNEARQNKGEQHV